MFTRETTVRIKKDKKFIEYIKIIRQYDNSLSMAQIKSAMEKDEVVFSFNPENNPVINKGKDNSSYFLEELFTKTLRQLKKAGATLVVMEGDIEHLEFSKVSSSKVNTNQLIGQLFDAKDGVAASLVIDKLKKIAKKDDSKRGIIIEELIRYSIDTPMEHLKSLTIIDINDIVKENETQYADFYISKIESGDFSAAYYAIEGFCKVMQKLSYDYLVETLLARKLNMECEALIVCELSRLSNNPFDQGSPFEKREWRNSDLKLEEIEAWRNAGYQDGNGYEKPPVHPCLKSPNSSEEKVYARLDAKLAKMRESNADKAHPVNWLVEANGDDIEIIRKKLNVPDNYLDFLIKASPLNVEIKLKGYGPVELYGAHELIEMQGGYSIDPLENRMIEAWPENYIVIAACFSNPFCIDALISDSPVYYAMHDMDDWEFDEVYPSFIDFLKALS